MVYEVEGALIQALTGVTGIKRVVNYPITEIGRDLPLLLLVYNGFEQRLLSEETSRIVLKWKATVFWPVDAKTMQRAWDQMKGLVPGIFNALRNNATLGSVSHGVLIEAGEPIISTSEAQYIGHSFNISVWKLSAVNLMRTKLGVTEPVIGRVYPSGSLE